MTGFPERPGEDRPDEHGPDGGHGDGDLSGRLDGGGPDPVEVLLRPDPEFLAAPPGSFDRIRRRAKRRRRARAAVGGGAAVAVLAGALYLVGSLTDGGGDEVVGPPASSATTTSPSPAVTGPTTRPAEPTPSRGGTPTQRPSAEPSDSRTATAPAGAPSAGPSGAPTTPSAPGATPMCATSQLTAELGGGDAGAGNLYRYLVLTNHGSASCHVNGYPGLSLLDGSGKQIGVPATRDERAHQEVVLAPGGSASDTVHTANQQGGCQTPSVRLRIYPPGNTASLTIPGEITVCDRLFTVTPFTAGTTGNPPS
ncbi:DUF4232 domain-containing protein [Actinacidiphila sp. DG2A-62]|uniref:DUF4232 domain-containing protein n=1 Tax=Actinacidiphila sp. DG2A-62 TaxID=3108821 RepID=UPI002DBE5D8A|nr:DUF4232 domain-containing protein [Actinacidiphila sp. DG2A-62]MEC3992190.1 DUF4232 domain-containing protein [Actinacidiphila sp. DG2A-62]